jgi:aerobic carbon-monoxide dehydrogenase medium subunit
MYPENFEYFRPKTLAEAARLLKGHRGARLLAGGHSLLPAMKFRVASATSLIDIGSIKGLSGIKAKGKALEIGATTTHAEIAASTLVRKSCPVLAEAAAQIGDIQVRNRGTIGGSIAHADPGADFPTVLVALGATILAKGPRGTRKIPADKFFVDLFTTALKPGEIVTAVVVPACGKGIGGSYFKHPHPASRYAVVGVAAVLELKAGKIARASLVVGGVTPNPVSAAAAEAALAGQKPDAAVISRAAARIPESIEDPLGDHYASGEFRVHLATVLARRALAAAAERARGEREPRRLPGS